MQAGVWPTAGARQGTRLATDTILLLQTHTTTGFSLSVKTCKNVYTSVHLFLVWVKILLRRIKKESVGRTSARGGGVTERGRGVWALIEVAAEERREVVGVVQRRPHAEGREQARRRAQRGCGAARSTGRYLARQLRREGAQPAGRQLAQRRVRVLHQRLVRVRLPRPARATCNFTHTTTDTPSFF